MRRCSLSPSLWYMRHSYGHPVQGFTLLEIMLAVIIFTVALLGLNSMQITAIRLNSAAQARTRIATVAQEQMEDLLVQPYTAPFLTDAEPLIGTATTYCVLYPPEGLRPCKTSNPPQAQGSQPYCRVTRQSSTGNECTDTAFPPPSSGYKIRWSVDKDRQDTIAHIQLVASHKTEGRLQTTTFALSFAKAKL